MHLYLTLAGLCERVDGSANEMTYARQGKVVFVQPTSTDMRVRAGLHESMGFSFGSVYGKGALSKKSR